AGVGGGSADPVKDDAGLPWVGGGDVGTPRLDELVCAPWAGQFGDAGVAVGAADVAEPVVADQSPGPGVDGAAVGLRAVDPASDAWPPEVGHHRGEIVI